MSNDAPAQLSELTFRDPYLRIYKFIDDPNQSFPKINYDVSYVNTASAPWSSRPATCPSPPEVLKAATSSTIPRPMPSAGTVRNKTAAQFTALSKNFVTNTGAAKIGQYFGGKGWPQYYSPNANDVRASRRARTSLTTAP